MPGEFEIIQKYFTRPIRHTVLGVGDDAALIAPSAGMELALTTDMLVAGTHFLADAAPDDLGWKTLAVNVSDLAAMGAKPRWALLAAAFPQVDELWIAAFAQGFFACAAAFDIDVIGGDTTRGPLNFCVTLIGETPRGQALRRAGAKPGDEIWVSGATGLAALGLAHLQGRCVLREPAACLAALHRPQPRVKLGIELAQRKLASAAIDISDGLLADLRHVLTASNVSARLHFEQLPDTALRAGGPEKLARESLLAGGDDYELLFTAPARCHDDILALTPAPPPACIGSVLPGPPGQIELLDAQGQAMTFSRHGFDHFADD